MRDAATSLARHAGFREAAEEIISEIAPIPYVPGMRFHAAEVYRPNFMPQPRTFDRQNFSSRDWAIASRYSAEPR